MGQATAKKDPKGRNSETGWTAQGKNAGKNKVVNIRLSPEEHGQIAKHAKENMRSISGQVLFFIRQAIDQAGH